MAQSSREAISPKTLLENIKKLIACRQGVVLTSAPRGGLQLALPNRLPTSFLKAYSQGAHAEDRLSWQAILRKKPVQPSDCWPRESFLGSTYSRELMTPLGLTHVVSLPLAAPLFKGYPGAIHLLRTEQQGPFTAANVSAAMSAVKAYDQRVAASRTSVSKSDGKVTAALPMGLTILDAKMRVIFGSEQFTGLDTHVREQMLDHARRRIGHLNTHGMIADRVHFPDAASNIWICRVVTYKRYPAIAETPVTLFCPQPHCSEWLSVRASDFVADPELARLIPTLKFMAKEFRGGPSLASISKVADLSPFHFHRRFTDLLGMTPKQFMLDCQIHECKSSLLDGKTELIEIAQGCGFAHQSHFTSRFKQATGQTPTRWRRTALTRPVSIAKRGRAKPR